MPTIEKYLNFLDTKDRVMNLDKWEIKKSSIAGSGVFATKKFNNGDLIDVVFIKKVPDMFRNQDLIRTEFGAYINHSSKEDNSELIENGDEYILKATKNINPGEEILSNYNKGIAGEIAVPFIEKN